MTTLTRPLFLLGVLALGAAIQTAPKASEGASIVEAWVDAMNGLDGTDESVERLVRLYHEDALHITSPEAYQIGTVTFDGAEAIRVMARRFSETYEHIVFRVDVVTVNETSQKLFHVAEGPWGGESVGVQLSLAYTRREDGVRFSVPAAAFFRIDQGKIRRARLYIAEGERAEVEPIS